MILVVVMVFGIIFLMQGPGMLRQGHRRDFFAFTVFLVIAFVLWALRALDVQLPYLGEAITAGVKSVFKLD